MENKEKIKQLAAVLTPALILVALTLFCWFKPHTDISVSERRELASLPQPSYAAVADGTFMEQFELYAEDQFPLRETFRTGKALSGRYLFARLDINGIYSVNGYSAAILAPLDEKSLEHAAGLFENLYEEYLSGTDVHVYLSVIPDKGYFLAQENGYPSLDYGELVRILRDGTPHMSYIDLFGELSVSDYYRTDTHWRQEKILDAVGKLAQGMGVSVDGADAYREVIADRDFYGVYAGQSALPTKPDRLVYLVSSVTEQALVYNYETEQTGSVYDLKKANDPDMYDLFLSGPVRLLRIENPLAETDRELVIFRDSFSSSAAPLLISGYKTVTLVDLRYIRSYEIGDWIDFDRQDVLFLFNTALLNGSWSLK